MSGYQEHYSGEPVNVIDTNGNFIFSGIITKLGTFHATVNEATTGENHDLVYSMIQKRNTMKKTAQAEIIKEEEKEGKKFILSKEENNVDGKLSVRYEVTVDEKVVWDSEEIVTNVYDVEKGWSAPDDFDETKLDLIQQTAESGFDMVVDSYDNMKEIVEEELAPPEPAEVDVEAEEEVPEGEPAFAPGEEPEAGVGGGAAMIGGEGEFPEEGEEVDVEAEAGGAEPFAEEPIEETTAASLEKPSLSRSVIAEKVKVKGDDRLHGNPQHRLNPALRAEMERRGIDSGETHDIELAEKLRDFDYSKPKGASLERLETKISNLTQEK